MLRFTRRMLRHDRGATAVEYGLIVALIVVVVIGGVRGVARVTIDMWGDVATKVVNA